MLTGGLLLVFLAAIAVLTVGDFNVRMANTHADEGPVLYAHYVNDPPRFEGDIMMIYGRVSVCATMMNWLPAMMYNFLNVPPEWPARVLTYLQVVLLGWALWRYTRQVTQRADVAWLTIAFAFAAEPWGWDLANAGLVFTKPYAASLAIPFIVLAATEIVADRPMRVLGWLVVAGLLHPSLTLLMVAMTGCVWLFAGNFERWRPRAVALAVPMLVCVLPSLLLQTGSDARLSSAEMMAGLRLNMHMLPWSYRPAWALGWPTFVGFVVLVGLALRRSETFSAATRRFFVGAAVGAAVLGGAHLLGLAAGVPKLLQMVPLRGTMLLVLFLLPAVMLYLANNLASTSWPVRWTAMALLLLHAVFGFGFHWLLVAVLAVGEFVEGRPNRWLSRATWPVLAVALAAYWRLKQRVLFLFGAGADQAAVFAGLPGLGGHERFAVLTVLGAAGLIGLLVRAKPVMVSAVIAVVALAKAHHTGQAARAAGFERANYEAQLWARDHTPADAVFVVYDQPWRTVSLRRTLDASRKSGRYIYSGSRRAKDLDDGLLAFYGLSDVVGSMNVAEMWKAQRRAYESLDEEGLLQLAGRFGGDYLVRPADKPLTFPVAYRNDELVIYQLSRS